jgi:hypothetical protein
MNKLLIFIFILISGLNLAAQSNPNHYLGACRETVSPKLEYIPTQRMPNKQPGVMYKGQLVSLVELKTLDPEWLKQRAINNAKYLEQEKKKKAEQENARLEKERLERIRNANIDWDATGRRKPEGSRPIKKPDYR